MYDEPTAGLDPVASTVVEDLIRSLQNQRGMSKSVEGISSYIVVTHQHSTIRRAVDRLIFLHEVTLSIQEAVSIFSRYHSKASRILQNTFNLRHDAPWQDGNSC